MNDENLNNKKWLGILQTVFWIFFIIFPLTTGLLSYHWLPNEAPMLSNGDVIKPFEIISSHEECSDNNCGTVVDAWRNTVTGETFTKGDFKTHRYNERNRMTATWFLYGLIGCFFFAGIQYYKKKDFFRYFGIAITINIIIALYTYLTSRI